MMLAAYRMMGDDEATDCLEKMYQNLMKKEYLPGEFAFILSIVFVLKSIGICPRDPNEYLPLMKEQLADKNEFHNTYEPILNESNPMKEDYLKALNELKGVCAINLDQSVSRTMSTFFGDDNINIKIWEYKKKHKEELLRNKAFFAGFDIDEVKKYLDEITSKGVINFLKGLNDIYDFSNISDFHMKDYDKLKQLKEHLEKVAYKGKIKDSNRKELLTGVNKIVDKLKVRN